MHILRRVIINHGLSPGSRNNHIGAPYKKYITTRCVNAVAQRRGLSKDQLLSRDWSSLQLSPEDLADWPLLQSLSAKPAAQLCTGRAVAQQSPVAMAAAMWGGVEESKESDPPGCISEDEASVTADGEGRDEWVVVTLGGKASGVGVFEAPLNTGKVAWHLPAGQIARLLPRAEEGATSGAVEEGWRQLDGFGAKAGWLTLSSPPKNDSEGPLSKPAFERFWTDRYLLNGFSSEVKRGSAVDPRKYRSVAGAKTMTSVATDDFWTALKQGGSAGGAAPEADAPVTGPSALFATPLQGDSDALLLSAVDVGVHEGVYGGSECNKFDTRPLLITGKWKIGLVTDTLTVTTRTSGCTRSMRENDSSATTLEEVDSATIEGEDQHVKPLPVLADGLLFGFRAADGLLVVTRAFPKTEGSSKARDRGVDVMKPVEQRAVANLGVVDEGVEVSFSIVDAGEDVMFSCRELGGQRRAATVRAKCEDTWGRGRAAFGARTTSNNSSSGWVRVVSQAHGATVRSGMSIDADGIVGRIPCGTVVPYDNAIIYHSPGTPNSFNTDPVARYRCIATVTTPAGWISERGRYADNPYRICKRVSARPQQPAHLLSHISVSRISVPPPSAGGGVCGGAEELFEPASTLPRARKNPRNGGKMTSGGDGYGDEEWRQRLGELPVLSVRFHLLQQLNQAVWKALRYANLSQGDLPWSMAALLSSCRHLIFSPLKQELWHTELARTARPLSPQAGPDGTPPTLELRLSRGRAARYARSSERLAIPEEWHTLFGQAFVALRDAPKEVFLLRSGEALYSTVFLGEHAHDAGGEYIGHVGP